jgi:gas vesicle protein
MVKAARGVKAMTSEAVFVVGMLVGGIIGVCLGWLMAELLSVASARSREEERAMAARLDKYVGGEE